MKKIRIIDTSVLCVYLKIPGFDHCGPIDNGRDFEQIDAALKIAAANGEEFVLPLAVVIETGNHIAKCNGDNYGCAQRLINIIEKSAENQSPWIFFGHQTDLWSAENILTLCQDWLDHVVAKSSLADISIKQVAEFYANTGSNDVSIDTGDEGLKAFEPRNNAIPIPRRRQ